MSKLFETTTIKSMILENRFVRSATWEGMANEDGSCTPKLIHCMAELARGEVGMIITGHAYVSREGQAGPWQMGIYGDELLPGLTQMADAVHQAGGEIVVQLAHAGGYAASNLSGLDALGPSTIEKDQGLICREMSREEIARIVQAFGDAATRAKRAGFDGVQIHSAHGYMLSQFLSPFYNKRTDEYGGSLENRSRIVLEVLKSIRDSVGNDFPVLIKLNSEDFVDGGLRIEEMLQVAKWLEKSGIDAIEMSGGTAESGKYSPVRPGKLSSQNQEAYYREAAGLYKNEISVPLVLVGGIRSYEVAEQLIESGLADYISMSRPLIREPHLIKRWKSGDTSRATCVSDNLCFNPGRAGEGIYCVTQEKLDNK
jgi:2,4-dienoyl-CoA reductase-like NADH-dependent reductase (Old Yellow Enzyme family)